MTGAAVGRGAGARLRLVVAQLVTTAVSYVWQMAQLHLRRPLPRLQHVVVMRTFRLFRRRFPVVLTYPNPLARGASLSLNLDLCCNHSLYVRASGRYEVEWLRLIAAAMAEAEVFIDVGAHIGVYAMTVAQAFPDRRVIAVEPLPDNFDKLASAVRDNGLVNVRAIRGVVAESAGRSVFHVSPLSDANGSLVAPQAYQTGDLVVGAEAYRARHATFAPTLDVDAVTLDDLIDAPSVIKIDVEGGEPAVLRSGERAFAKGLVDLMVVEVQGTTYEVVLTHLNDLGFDGFLYGHRLPLRPGQLQLAPYRVVNVLFLRRGSSAYDRVDFS